MKKTTLRIWILLIAATLAACLLFTVNNRASQREATEAEIVAHSAYGVDWTQIPGWNPAMTEQEFVLNLCSFAWDESMEGGTRRIFSSDILGEYLYRCEELDEIAYMNDILYITYYASDKDMIVLAYDGEGLRELAVFDDKTDMLFHQNRENCIVWENYRGGFQLG